MTMKHILSTFLILATCAVLLSVESIQGKTQLAQVKAFTPASAQENQQAESASLKQDFDAGDMRFDRIEHMLSERGVKLPSAEQAMHDQSKLLSPLMERTLAERGQFQDAGGESYQRRGIPDWSPDDPWTPEMLEEMPTPDTEEVREAIRFAVNYLLEEQQEQGQWDVVLDETLLGATADQAVDAVAATSLVGLALRPHHSFAPKRIDEACEKGLRFIMNAIFRGKLSTRVYYAIWRYTLGLRFLCQEYRLVPDTRPDYKDEMRAAAYRMVNSILSMQFSADGSSSLGNMRRARVRGGKGASARPTISGFILQPPTDEDYRGGALVVDIVPGTGADNGKFEIGDRLVECEGLRIENAVDWQNVEQNFVEEQRIKISYIRPSVSKTDRSTEFMSFPKRWPSSIGVFGVETEIVVDGDSEAGLEVTQVMIGSPLEGILQERVAPTPRNPNAVPRAGDVIYEVDGEPVTSEESLAEILKDSEPGDKVKVEWYHKDKNGNWEDMDERVETISAPNGTTGMAISEEDKEVGEGVVVGELNPWQEAFRAGIRWEDRITHINDVPIFGYDHFEAYMNTQWAGKSVKFSILRDGDEMEIEFKMQPTYVPGDLQVQLDPEENEAVVMDVTRRGASHNKLRRKDVITAISFDRGDGEMMEIPTPTKAHLYGWINRFPAGMTVVVHIRRGTNVSKEEIVLAEKKSDPNVMEEGGWNYYMDLGHAMSFVTGYVVIALKEVDELLDFGIPDDVYKLAAGQLEASRKEDERAKADGYIYRADTGTDIRGHMGRIVLCEMAMEEIGRRRKGDIEKALENWLVHRGELDKVRNFVLSRTGPHCYELYANAAYYWMYGHYWAMEGAHVVGGSMLETTNDTVLKCMMLNRRENDLWLGHHAFGVLCGTAQALMVFGQLEGDFRNGQVGGSKDDTDDGKYDREGDE